MNEKIREILQEYMIRATGGEAGSTATDIAVRKLSALMERELPENPYPESIFTMTVKEYVETIPDEILRTRISGFLMREGWNVCQQSMTPIAAKARTTTTAILLLRLFIVILLFTDFTSKEQPSLISLQLQHIFFAANLTLTP